MILVFYFSSLLLVFQRFFPVFLLRIIGGTLLLSMDSLEDERDSYCPDDFD